MGVRPCSAPTALSKEFWHRCSASSLLFLKITNGKLELSTGKMDFQLKRFKNLTTKPVKIPSHCFGSSFGEGRGVAGQRRRTRRQRQKPACLVGSDVSAGVVEECCLGFERRIR